MNTAELFDLVEAHRDLEGVGIVAEKGHDDAAIILHRPSNIATRVPVSALPQLTVEQLLPILTMERDPNSLIHMSRVCGYFSRLGSWNRSKMGELKDRISGSYGMGAERTPETREAAVAVAASYSS